ncbi:MAG TPA: YggT family protein [Candidatus Kryptonia bacterium]|nr:YggT family protein [Candidatus Kryptonia bacterium]
MFILSNFLLAVAQALNLVLWMYMWIIIGRAVISWVNPDPSNPIVRFLYSATEPLLYRVRRAIPIFAGGIDFSAMIVLIAIYFLQSFLVRSLIDLATGLR